MAKTTITRGEYLQLKRLAKQAAKNSKRVAECTSAICGVIGVGRDDEHSAYVTDVTYGDANVPWLLEQMKIAVVD